MMLWKKTASIIAVRLARMVIPREKDVTIKIVAAAKDSVTPSAHATRTGLLSQLLLDL
jgi:hypothetical protein